MSIIKFIPESIVLDNNQQVIIEYLEQQAKNLENRRSRKNIWGTKILSPLRKFNKFINKQPAVGIYLYGGVGRGKTMLMKAFYNRVNTPKQLVHFQNFMQQIHKKMHQLQSLSKQKIVDEVAKDIAKKYKLFAIDEFEIKDIADAMLIMRLFKELAKLDVFIFITTNIKPDDLYKDGLQRELFKPCIDHLNENFSILCLDSPVDYRLRKKISQEKRIFYPINGQNKALLNQIKKALLDYNLAAEQGDLIDDKIDYDKLITKKSIILFGREINFNNTYKDCLFTDFSELICQDFGYADYVNICQEFNIIVLENVEKISESETDKITRLINFIDNAYFYKVILFISLHAAPEEIYGKGFRAQEFQRSISRLSEMNSEEY